MLRNGSAEGATPHPTLFFRQIMRFTNACTFGTSGMSDFVARATSIVRVFFFTGGHNHHPVIDRPVNT